jgi:hypothetical protein
MAGQTLHTIPELQQARPIPGPKSFNKELELNGDDTHPPAKVRPTLSRLVFLAHIFSTLTISLYGQIRNILPSSHSSMLSAARERIPISGICCAKGPVSLR